MEEWYAVIFLGIVFIVAVGLLRLISFAVEDIRQQGKGEHLPLPALMMFGLVSFIAWPFIRSKKSPPENIVRVYESSEDAFSDAQRMEALGDWDAALRAYGQAAELWPEHQPYAVACITRIQEKQKSSTSAEVR